MALLLMTVGVILHEIMELVLLERISEREVDLLKRFLWKLGTKTGSEQRLDVDIVSQTKTG